MIEPQPRNLRLAIAVVALIAIADAVLLGFSRLGFVARSALPLLLAAVALLPLYWRYARREPRLAQIIVQALLFAAATNALAVLSYLLTGLGAGLPMVDGTLAAADQRLGLDWPAMYRWLSDRPPLALVAQIFYGCAGPQLVLLIILLSHLRRPDRAAGFFAGFVLTGLLTVLIGAALPAFGAFVQFHTAEARTTPYVLQVLALRSGTFAAVDLRKIEGIVQFPSFHAALALLCWHAVRGLRGWSPALAVISVLIVAVTPFCGGHYFADVFAGLLLALAVIALLGRLDRRPATGE